MRTIYVAALAMLTGCASAGAPTVAKVDEVDLQRFMGDWYVIANIPSYPERDAYGAVESYERLPDGRIRTTFRYHKGSFDAPEKTMHPVATVVPGTGNAVWGMQFVWPIRAEYVIGWLAPDYSQTLIVRSKRDYAWLMARTPTLPEADVQAAIARLREMGYDVSKLRRVPQKP